jgi:hypothetical protein
VQNSCTTTKRPASSLIFHQHRSSVLSQLKVY